MVKETELYDLLGTSPDADEETLKKAFRRAALKYHPDRYSGAGEEEQMQAQKKFSEINNAYDILKEQETRERYDRGGMKAVQEGGDDGDGPGDIFSALFGGGGGRGGARREPKPKDTSARLDVPLEEFYSGATRQLAVTRQRFCSACAGKGTKSGKEATCQPCGGQGGRNVMRQVAPGLVMPTQVACAACKGSGQAIAPGDKCPRCDGDRVVEDRKVFDVVIEKGMKHGDAITFADEGNQIPGVRRSGDVVVLLAGKHHPSFVRKGRALLTQVTVPLADALCGFKITIKHLDGRFLVINPLEGQVLKPDMTCLVSREGMPVRGTGGTERGDLVVQVNVDFPKQLTADQVAKLRAALGPMTVPVVPATESKDGEYETTMTEVHTSLEDLEKDGARDEQQRSPRDGPRVRKGKGEGKRGA